MRIIELFGGIGAPREAFRNLGMTVDSTYVEINKHATRFYNLAFGEDHKPTDIRDFRTSQNFDFLIHGSPCQDFSSLGSGLGLNGKKSSLLYES